MLPTSFRILLGCLCVFIVVPNTCVCLLVYMHRSLRSYTNAIVVSLAVSDILTGAVLLPMYVTVPEFADALRYIVCIIMLAGVTNVCTVTLDRYLAIKRPFDYLAIMHKQFRKIMVLSWALPIAIAFIPMSFSTQSELANTIYLFTLQGFCVVVPYILVFVAYCQIFQQARHIVNRIKRESTVLSWQKDDKSTKKKRDAATEAKVAKVFSVIAVSFILSWLPVIYLTSVLAAVGQKDSKLDELSPPWLQELSLITVALGSLVNPGIYSFLKPDFKRVLKTLLRKCTKKPKQKVPDHEKSSITSTVIRERLESGNGGPETNL